jgi:chromosome segregation ATPase
MSYQCRNLVGNMGKLSVSLPDSVLTLIESESRNRGKNRSHLVSDAVEFYVRKSKILQNDINKLTDELEEKKSLTEEVGKLEENIRTKEEEFRTIENQLAETKKSLNQKENELFLVGKKVHALENQLTEKDKLLESKSKEASQMVERINQSNNDFLQLKADVAKFESALRAKEDECSFLRGHVAQLVQTVGQISLKPGDEEIKKKGWWQFWK